MNRDRSWYWRIVTLGPVGLLPAPGTCGTVISALFFIACASYSVMFFRFCFLGVLVVGSYALTYLTQSGVGDEPSIIIDEAVATGLMVMFVSGWWLVLAVLLFRFFDILKVGGITLVERLPGAWGIMLDDVAAAFYAMGCVQCLQFFFL